MLQMSASGLTLLTGSCFNTCFRRTSMVLRAPLFVSKRRYASRQTLTTSFSAILLSGRCSCAMPLAAASRRDRASSCGEGMFSGAVSSFAAMTPMAASGKSFQNDSSTVNCMLVLSRAIGCDYATIAREGKQGGLRVNALQYEKISAPFRARPSLARALLAANKALTAAFYVLYPVLLAMLFFTQSALLVPCMCVPAAGFVCLSAFRARFNAPRPYELLSIDPLIQERYVGAVVSEPSRVFGDDYCHVLACLVPLGWMRAACGRCVHSRLTRDRWRSFPQRRRGGYCRWHCLRPWCAAVAVRIGARRG